MDAGRSMIMQQEGGKEAFTRPACAPSSSSLLVLAAFPSPRERAQGEDGPKGRRVSIKQQRGLIGWEEEGW